MAVMRHLTVDGTTYDTVGEASVTQVQTSGTKIATVSIDGTSTDIYAPSGGSSVEPSSTTPSMDGTAAVGSSDKYAREDHVHPTDTSRQAALVSGTNIKTVNNESLLGSGNIAIGGSTTTWYGETATGATTSTKIVTCTGFELQTGAIISVLFTYGSSSSSMSLNVNSTGAITVYKGGDALSSTNYKNIAKNSVVTFIYSGTYWYVISESPFSSGVLFSDAGNMSSSSGNYTLNLTTSTSTNVSSPIDGLMLAVKFINDCPNVYKIKLNNGATFSVYAYESPRGWAAVSSTFKLPAYADDLCFFVANNYSWYFLGRINQYTLPTASESTLGGVKVGSGLSITSDGTLSASGGSQSWTDITSQLTTTTFEGTVLTDGHLCVIISEQDGTTDDGAGDIIQGLPLPHDYVYFTASRNRVNIPLVVDTDGILKLSFPEESYPDDTFDGFTIIYPITSS